MNRNDLVDFQHDQRFNYMGTWYTFECPSCGYSAVVSGGRDWGMAAVVQTMVCSDCKDVVDVIIGEEGEVYPRIQSDSKEQDLYPAKIFPSDSFYVCPNCKNANMTNWENHTFPKCQEIMVKTDDEILWD